jgi:hypothetical protein
MKDEPMSLSPQVPPPGFEPHFRQSRLTDPWEPLFSRRLAGEAIILGLQAGEQHANSRGFVHGGLIASLADNAMGLSCHEHLKDAAPAGLVTVSLGIDYLGDLPLDAALREGADAGVPAAVARPDGDIAARFAAIAGTVAKKLGL